MVDQETPVVDQVREAAVQLLVETEHLQFFRTPDGLSLFGTLCEITGMVLQHLAAGRQTQAIRVVENLGCSLPRGATPEEQDAFAKAMGEFLLTIRGNIDSPLH